MRRLIISTVLAASTMAVGACHHAPPRAMPTPNPANMLVTTAWLAEHLDETTPTIVAMHHPPFITGIGHMDRIGLLEGAASAK